MLSFEDYYQEVIVKASGSLKALQSIIGLTWGASLKAMQIIYQGVVIPQLL
jgi:hypothetical protein